LSAGWVKLFDPKIGFPAAAQKYGDAMAQGKLLAPAKTAEEMQRIVTNNNVDAALTGLFMLLVVTAVAFGIRAILRARAAAQPTANEEPYVALGSMAGATR
jgi:flagellar biosynthesis/type III secretory pathway M-ring protein FliF/YscJ